MNYIEAMRRPRRFVVPVAVAVLINGWLVYALWHGNVFPFPRPEHLIRVTIYRN